LDRVRLGRAANYDYRGVSTVSRAAQTPSEGPVDTEGSTDETTDADEAVSTDEVFELLSNKRRRFAIHYLKRTDDQADLGNLSEHVAAWETDTPLREVDSAQRKRVYTSLQSHHLPKLDDQGVVDYDERAGEVELTDTAADLEMYLEIVDRKDVPWSQYYLGLAGISAIIIAGALLDSGPFALLPDIGWAAFVVTSLAVSAAVHVYHDTSRRLGTSEKPPELRDT
jgi:hypothetical protein